MEMLIKAALPSGTGRKTWVWEKAYYPVGQVQGMPLELPKAVPVEASGCWGHWLTAGAQVQALLPQGLARNNVPWVGVPRAWQCPCLPWESDSWQSSARCTWHHPAQTSGDHPVHVWIQIQS